MNRDGTHRRAHVAARRYGLGLLVMALAVLAFLAMPEEVEARDCKKCNKWGACQIVKRGVQNRWWVSVPGMRRCRQSGPRCPKGRDKGSSVLPARVTVPLGDVLVVAGLTLDATAHCAPTRPIPCRIPNGALLSSCGSPPESDPVGVDKGVVAAPFATPAP